MFVQTKRLTKKGSTFDAIIMRICTEMEEMTVTDSLTVIHFLVLLPLRRKNSTFSIHLMQLNESEE
jgi:hypothetical protein